MNAFQQFRKDHPALFNVYLGIFMQAAGPGVTAAYEYLINPTQFPINRILVFSAAVFLASLISGVAHYLATDTGVQKSAPEVAAIAQAAAPYIAQFSQQELNKLDPTKQRVASPSALPAAAPVPTYTSTSVGSQIANGMSIPNDFTQAATAKGPVMFTQPYQAPVSPASAFHDLLQTQAVPVPPTQNADWLNSTPKQG